MDIYLFMKIKLKNRGTFPYIILKILKKLEKFNKF